MKVLILTNPNHIEFVTDVVHKYKSDDWNYTIQYLGKATFPFIDYDIGISFMYPYKVPAKEVNTHTWINFHPAPLPEYKGRNLCYHAIMNGEQWFGATVHYMDENFDTGDIIEYGMLEILRWWTSDDLSRETMKLCKQLFKAYFPEIIAGKKFKRHPNVGGTYYEKSVIPDTLELRDDYGVGQFVRAVTYKEFYPKIVVGGVTYKIVREE